MVVGSPYFYKKRDPLLSHLFFADNLMLISEASMDQATMVSNILEMFCYFSGQKVSEAKS